MPLQKTVKSWTWEVCELSLWAKLDSQVRGEHDARERTLVERR